MYHPLPPSTLLSLLLLHSLLSGLQTVATPHPGPQLTDRMVKVCGRQLANMLSVVCQGKYYHTGKRSVEDEDLLSLPDFEKAVLKRQISQTDHFQRVTKGIYDECCREKCKLSTLKEYCE